MGKPDIVKDSVKSIISMMIIILIFVIGILAVNFSALLVGQQEEFKITGGEEVYVNRTQGGSSGSSIVVENDRNLKVQVVNPVSPTKGVKGQ